MDAGQAGTRTCVGWEDPPARLGPLYPDPAVIDTEVSSESYAGGTSSSSPYPADSDGPEVLDVLFVSYTMVYGSMCSDLMVGMITYAVHRNECVGPHKAMLGNGPLGGKTVNRATSAQTQRVVCTVDLETSDAIVCMLCNTIIPAPIPYDMKLNAYSVRIQQCTSGWLYFCHPIDPIRVISDYPVRMVVTVNFYFWVQSLCLLLSEA